MQKNIQNHQFPTINCYCLSISPMICLLSANLLPLAHIYIIIYIIMINYAYIIYYIYMYTRQSNSSYKHGTIPILGIPTIQFRNDVKFAWKVQRDVEERGWTEEQVRSLNSVAWGSRWVIFITSMYSYMGMDQYLLIPFLVGWTSIYQLFWGSLGTRVLTHPHIPKSKTIICW